MPHSVVIRTFRNAAVSLLTVSLGIVCCMSSNERFLKMWLIFGEHVACCSGMHWPYGTPADRAPVCSRVTLRIRFVRSRRSSLPYICRSGRCSGIFDSFAALCSIASRQSVSPPARRLATTRPSTAQFSACISREVVKLAVCVCASHTIRIRFAHDSAARASKQVCAVVRFPQIFHYSLPFARERFEKPDFFFLQLKSIFNLPSKPQRDRVHRPFD